MHGICHKPYPVPPDEWNAEAELSMTSFLLSTLPGPQCGNGGVIRYLNVIGYHSLHCLEVADYGIERLSPHGITMHFSVPPEISSDYVPFNVVIACQAPEKIIQRGKFVLKMVLQRGSEASIFVPNNCLRLNCEKADVIKKADTLERFLSRYLAVVKVQEIEDAIYPIGLNLSSTERHYNTASASTFLCKKFTRVIDCCILNSPSVTSSPTRIPK